MGLGNTAKKLSRLADVAEELYKRVNAMREEIADLRTTVDNAEGDAAALRRELAEQRALIEAIADDENIDTQQVLADADLPDPAGTPPGEDENDDEQNPTDSDGGDSDQPTVSG